MIQIKDLIFVPYINETDLLKAVNDVAQKINADYKGKEVLFVGVLNGVFMFASDLMKHIDLKCQISFVKLSSYDGTQSTENVKQLFGLKESVEGKHIILLEDIVDTGITIDGLYNDLLKQKPASLEICTLLFKPEKYTKQVPIKYIARSISNEFVVGYGLDYDGYGRNISSIYQLKP
ncbi:MAG: hypoxanthine phosphoribosyltransferase [Bacteroidales bacterium]|jgi:hypoxanthine phosphoribosyltransferase|nr:hypoxanthine phosphoribosyltransferase [Bacteroidales bacterium]